MLAYHINQDNLFRYNTTSVKIVPSATLKHPSGQLFSLYYHIYEKNTFRQTTTSVWKPTYFSTPFYQISPNVLNTTLWYLEKKSHFQNAPIHIRYSLEKFKGEVGTQRLHRSMKSPGYTRWIQFDFQIYQEWCAG